MTPVSNSSDEFDTESNFASGICQTNISRYKHVIAWVVAADFQCGRQLKRVSSAQGMEFQKRACVAQDSRRFMNVIAILDQGQRRLLCGGELVVINYPHSLEPR